EEMVAHGVVLSVAQDVVVLVERHGVARTRHQEPIDRLLDVAGVSVLLIPREDLLHRVELEERAMKQEEPAVHAWGRYDAEARVETSQVVLLDIVLSRPRREMAIGRNVFIEPVMDR